MKAIYFLIISVFLLSSAAASWWGDTRTVIRSVTLTDSGTLEVIRTQSRGVMYSEGGGPPDYAWKDIYASEGGKICLVETIEGYYHPEDTRIEVVPEKYDFNR